LMSEDLFDELAPRVTMERRPSKLRPAESVPLLRGALEEFYLQVRALGKVRELR
jgi:hypothetical protein